MLCRCPACCPADPGPTYTTEFRQQCEARFALAMPLLERRAYLVEVQKWRGFAGREVLEAAIRIQWEAKRNGR